MFRWKRRAFRSVEVQDVVGILCREAQGMTSTLPPVRYDSKDFSEAIGP